MKEETTKRLDLSMLVEINRPEKVFDEAVSVLSGLLPADKIKQLHVLYNDVASLYNGDYPGFMACNVEYHGLRHTTDVFLCFARLIHGFGLHVSPFKGREIFLGLTAAMMHDTGYIQAKGDTEGTGAKYTKEHVKRSIDFMKKYFAQNGYSPEDFKYAGCLILATQMDLRLQDIPYVDDRHKEMGGLLFASDMIGQMSDRPYLEKLLFLYREFKEAKLAGFDSEMELFEKTTKFYKDILHRLSQEVPHYDVSLRRHFIDRYKIDRNLYIESIENNMSYLSKILEESKESYRTRLNRYGMVRKLERLENKKKFGSAEWANN